MIKIEKTEVVGWEEAIRGMRNPMNSWDKSDSDYRYVLGQKCDECGKYVLPDEHSCDGCEINDIHFDDEFAVGPNDHDLMMRLAKAGPVEGKYRRMIVVYADITAPLYWWKEFDTYKVGTVANSCSTMHKIHEKEFTLSDFSVEHLYGRIDGLVQENSPLHIFRQTVAMLNCCRDIYLKTREKESWYRMIQLLPSSYNQKRTVMLNYEVLANIYRSRRSHKLDEWREFCQWIEGLPYSEVITCSVAEQRGQPD